MSSFRPSLSPILATSAAIALLTLASSTTGCATVVSGTKQEVHLTSHPAVADIVITSDAGIDVFTGRTPAVVRLPRKESYTVSAKVPGHAPVKARIDQELNGWFCGNILCGGIVGGIVDYVTGAMWNLDPEMLSVSLVPAPGMEGEPSSERVVLLFRATDDRGELRELALPLFPEAEQDPSGA